MFEAAKANIEDYPFITSDKIRYNDTDRQGHVNNAVFGSFFETGRVELLYHPHNPLTAEGCEFVVAVVNITLLAEMHWPGTVEIGTAVVKLGNSSITVAQSLYQDAKICGTAETVIVQINSSSRKSAGLNESTRNFLKTQMAPGLD